MKPHERIYQLLDDKIVPYAPTSPDNGYEPAPRKEDESDKEYFLRLGFQQPYPKDPLTWTCRFKGEGPEYLARWHGAGELAFIFVWNWPDLLKLRILLAPVLQTHYLQQIAATEAERLTVERRR